MSFHGRAAPWQCTAKAPVTHDKAVPTSQSPMATPCRGADRPWQGLSKLPPARGTALPRAAGALATPPSQGPSNARPSVAESRGRWQRLANGTRSLGNALPRTAGSLARLCPLISHALPTNRPPWATTPRHGAIIRPWYGVATRATDCPWQSRHVALGANRHGDVLSLERGRMRTRCQPEWP